MLLIQQVRPAAGPPSDVARQFRVAATERQLTGVRWSLSRPTSNCSDPTGAWSWISPLVSWCQTTRSQPTASRAATSHAAATPPPPPVSSSRSCPTLAISAAVSESVSHGHPPTSCSVDASSAAGRAASKRLTTRQESTPCCGERVGTRSGKGGWHAGAGPQGCATANQEHERLVA